VSQGVDINDKHIELIARQMLQKVRVDQKGDTGLPPGAVRRPAFEFARVNNEIIAKGGEPGAVRGHHPRHHEGLAEHGLVPVGPPPFQETTKVLTDAALEGKIRPP